MTDEELIEGLRKNALWVTTHDAADRMEQLVAINEELVKELHTSRMASVIMDNTVAEAEAKLAKAVKLIGYAIELGRFELNPKLLDDLIHFKTEIELEKTE